MFLIPGNVMPVPFKPHCNASSLQFFRNKCIELGLTFRAEVILPITRNSLKREHKTKN